MPGLAPIRSAWDDYVRGLQVAGDWLALARQSQDPRHLETALVCLRVARERLDRLLAEGLDVVQRQELDLIELAAQTAAHVEEARNLIAESRALLNRPIRRMPGSSRDAAEAAE